MLLGFGWQWMIDRYMEREERWDRFKSANAASFRRVNATLGGKPVPVYEFYPPGHEADWDECVVRGAPEVIGGAGTTTRRFSLFPLRGYANVGFRYVVKKIPRL